MNWFRRPKGKYGAKRVDHAGMSFASKLESRVYDVLKLRERAGEIDFIQSQQTVRLYAGIGYRVDFVIRDKKSEQLVWVEAKGFETPEWKLKLKLWKEGGPGPLEIWRAGRSGEPYLDETIIPKGPRP